ncbi:MAG: ATP-binding protein [Anaerolineae bacterium]|nr:ATP-binding protein [Anaerolineae bacterium]
MSHWIVPFINREDELALIGKHLAEWNTRRVIFVWGEGGIGKTRLLDEVTHRFGSQDVRFPLKMLPALDFDDGQYAFTTNIGVMIAQHLDESIFAPYLSALHKSHLAEKKGAEAAAARLSVDVERCFVECFNRASSRQRVVLRIDTTDAMEDSASMSYLFDIIHTFKNVLILIAGRNAGQLYEKFGETIGADAVPLKLRPLTLGHSRDYLKLKQDILKITLDPDWMSKLFVLAGGVPVLIDLAIEWAQHNRDLPWMQELSSADLEALRRRAGAGDEDAQARLAALEERFKETIVMPVAQLRSNMDYLKFILAKVYPLDVEGVAEMLDLSAPDAEVLFERAGHSVSIKALPDGRIKLHDEVQRLVNTYVWPHLDAGRQWEFRDSSRAVSYLARKSDALLEEARALRRHEAELVEADDPEVIRVFSELREKQSAFWTLRIERLGRQLAIEVQSGYAQFQEDYQLAYNEVPGVVYREGLLSKIRPYADLDAPTPDIKNNTLPKTQRLEVQYLLAQHATSSGHYNWAADAYERLLGEVPPDSEPYIENLNGQANLQVRAGRLQEALRTNERALELSQKLSLPKWVIQSTLEIGWVHRLMGNLDQAVEFYNEAFRLALAQDDDERIALIYNNLAYAHALQHDERAIDEIQVAIRAWHRLVEQRTGYRFRLGQCYNVAGEVYVQMEKPGEALRYFELSWSIFAPEESAAQSGDVQERAVAEWQSRSRQGRGYAYWQLAMAARRKGDTPGEQHNLQSALRDLTWAAEYATEIDSPTALERLGEVHFALGNYESAARIWGQSVDESQKVGDAYSELKGLGHLARLAFHYPVKDFPTWQDFERHYKRNYRQRYPTAHFETLIGLFYTYLGHLALKSEEINDTIDLYERGLSMLSQRGSYYPFNLIEQLNFIESKILPRVRPASARRLGEALTQKWITSSRDVAALVYFRQYGREP